MANEAEGPAGSIFDLGYRRYAGERLGRRYAIESLYIHSLRAAFGIGRSLLSKAFPIGLALIALVPAAIQLGIAAVIPQRISIIRPENYFSFVQVILALFCTAVAPDLIGRDQQTRTLPLYFSRPLSRADYVSAKLGALLSALLIVVLLPQVVLLAGNSLATEDSLAYLRDDLDQVPSILASAATVAVFMASLSLAVACQTPRRVYATGAVLVSSVVFSALGRILVHSTSGDLRMYSILVSPLDVLQGSVTWLFGARPEANSDIALAGLPGGLYLLAACVYSVVALAVLYRRFQRLPA